MCDKEKRVFGAAIACAPRSVSRRQRLWELPSNTHCPVIGVCLPLALLRRLVNKGVRGQALADDYDIHVGAVAECAARNRISNLLQEALDHRYGAELQQFKPAAGADAVLQLWRRAVADGDVAGAFWAALTHPRSDFLVQDTVLREMHMIGHQAGASTRVDQVRFRALLAQHAALGAELAQERQRHSRALAGKAQELAQCNAALMRARAQVITRDSSLAFLRTDFDALKAAVPELDARLRLQERVDSAARRLAERDALVARLREELAAALRPPVAAEAVAIAAPDAAAAVPAPRLANKTVLCVGGRSASVPGYRCMTEQAGGRFVHHDGGQEQGVDQLDASLAAADLVICQTACISHNAYWRVKEYCKRSGKQCVFVENPSSTSYSRGLRQIAIMAA